MRAPFAALICIIAIGSFAADLRFLDYFGPFIVVGLLLLSFALVGSLLVIRRAGGPIGWLLGAAGAFFQLGALADAYGHASLEAGAALPGGELALWSGTFIWPAVLGSVVCALVLFPDGRPPGRAFAILLWAFAACAPHGLVYRLSGGGWYSMSAAVNPRSGLGSGHWRMQRTTDRRRDESSPRREINLCGPPGTYLPMTTPGAWEHTNLR